MSPLPNGDQASRMLSEPPNTSTPCSRRSFSGGMVAPPGPWLMIATPALASTSAVRAALSVGTEPKREGVAHGDLALQAGGRPCARRSPASARCRLRRRRAGGCRCRHRGAPAMPKMVLEMAVEIAVDADGIEAAQKVGALGDGLVEQLRGARRTRDAALREGHDLDGDEIAEALAHLQYLVKVPETKLVVDVDVAAHVQRAARHHLAHEIGAGFRLRHRAGRPHLALGLDAVGDPVAGGLVGHPRQAEQGLVEMDVAVDQRRQQQRAREVEHFAASWHCCRGGEEGGDPPSLDLDVTLRAVRQDGVGDQHRFTWRRRRPLPCGSGSPPRGRPWPSGRCRWRW